MKKRFLVPVWRLLVVLFVVICTTPSVWAMATFQQYTQAVGLYRSGQYSQAYQQFSSLMKAHPEDVRLPYYMGLTAVRLGKIDQAKHFYETVLTIAPKSLVAPYAKQGLALLQEAQKLDAPPNPPLSITLNPTEKVSISSPAGSAVAMQAIDVSQPSAKHNNLVAQWQKTHPVTKASSDISEMNATSVQSAQPITNEKPVQPALPASEPVGVVSTMPTAMSTPAKEIAISPAMLAVSATGSAGVAPIATTPATAQTAAEAQLQQQQQLMQTMMMMQMMGGSGGGNSGGGGGNNANPMAMMLPMMMMQQQQQQNPAGGTTGVANPFSGIDPKMMSDMMTQGMMNNLDLFSDSKKDN
jgi:hypothetical protein